MGFVFQPRRLAQAAALSVLAGSCVALAATPAEAILTFYIFENPANSNKVRLQAQGSLNLGAPDIGPTSNACSLKGSIDFDASLLCAGSFGDTVTYTSVTPFANTANFLNYVPSSLIVDGISASDNLPTANPNPTPYAFLDALSNRFYISPNYVSGGLISSFSDFSGTFTQLGFGNTTGTLGTWTIGTGPVTDSINIQFGAPPGPGPGPGSTVPGPLPVLGGAAAFGWSRRLRRRIQA